MQSLQSQNMLLGSLRRVIGNTPMFAIDCTFRGSRRTIFAKAEQYNFTGSIKDRMALHILTKAYEQGVLRPGGTIIEATSGNTGIAFAALGRALGHEVVILMPDWMSKERQDLLKSYGATVKLVSRQDGGFTGAIEQARVLAEKTPGAFLPEQFENQANTEAHQLTTGPEIWYQFATAGLVPDAFVAGVGTGGTVMGVGAYLKRRAPECRIHPLEPANSPTLSTGYKVGKHRIQGISDEFIPAILDLDSLDGIIAVDDGDAIRMAQYLAAVLGLGVGISSGANFIGALLVQEKLGANAVVVTVLPDDNKKYLSTQLTADEPSRKHFISNEVTLTGLRSFRRACQTCPDLVSCWPDGPGPWN